MSSARGRFWHKRAGKVLSDFAGWCGLADVAKLPGHLGSGRDVMQTRRHVLLLAAMTPVAYASTYGEVLRVGPKPKLIKGNPDKVDFGHGLLIPMSRDAFEVLWEGDDRWITYGHGFGQNKVAAMAQAEEAAIGTMKLMLLTLAFAPDRLERIDGGGWRLKSRDVKDLVRGDVKLPGRPIMPTTDEMYGYIGGETGDTDRDDETTHATTGWLLWKKDVTLDYVRRTAQLVPN